MEKLATKQRKHNKVLGISPTTGDLGLRHWQLV